MAEPNPSKRPLVVAGGIVAAFVGGTAAGIALGLRRRPSNARRVLDGARKAGEAVQRLGEIQAEMHAVREQVEHNSRRSPIEVVLSGLTHRPGEPR